MGWADCGKNRTTDEDMGYAHEGICHAEGCNAEIDHGLAYVCGAMHEGGEDGCGYYFCGEHLGHYLDAQREMSVQLCEDCGEAWRKARNEELSQQGGPINASEQ